MVMHLLEGMHHAVASRPDHGILGHLHGWLYGRPFRGRRRRRLLVLFEPKRVSYASAFAFLSGAPTFEARHDVEIRLLPTETALRGALPAGLGDATHVVAESWLTDPVERHQRLADVLDAFGPDAVTAYLDTSANADIRLARVFAGVDFYFKKSLFTDRAAHLKPTYGHTNLTDYYGRLYDVPQEETDWCVPPGALPKLHVAPNFLTAPALRRAFLRNGPPPGQAAREITLHARLGGTEADNAYGAMRRAALRAVEDVGQGAVTGTGIPYRRFMQELSRAKICFSPFGYGELCWRDMEAMAAGAVLLKPDMSHLETTPDLYRNNETYLACRWDFADLPERVNDLLADDARRDRIARTAWEAARQYLLEDGPVETYAPLFR